MEWIGIVIFVVIVVGSWVSNILKEQKKKGQTRQGAELGRRESSQVDSASSGSRLTELAARRRAQLEQLAGQRSGEQRQSSGQSRSSRSQPVNLTADQQSQRDEARATYERRAAALGSGRESPHAGDFKVIRVVDGDTLVIHYDGEDTYARLSRINAPERDQHGGSAATNALRSLVDGKTVQINFTSDRKRDKFGRLLASVFVDGVDVERELVRAGVAQWRSKPTRQQSVETAVASDLGSHRPGKGVTKVDESAARLGGQLAHRRVPDAPMPRRAKRRAPLARFMASGSLRSAIVIKEILDRPISLRSEQL